jgi:hypothetical protein
VQSGPDLGRALNGTRDRPALRSDERTGVPEKQDPMSQFRKSHLVALATASLAIAMLAAGPASAQYYDRGYFAEPEYAPPGYGRRGYGPPPRAYGEPRGYDQRRGYDDGRGYGQPRGNVYGGQGGVYFDKETAKRNARALKEQQKDAIKSGRGAYIAPGYQQQQYQAPRGGGGYPVPRPGATAGQGGVPDDPYRNRN